MRRLLSNLLGKAGGPARGIALAAFLCAQTLAGAGCAGKDGETSKPEVKQEPTRRWPAMSQRYAQTYPVEEKPAFAIDASRGCLVLLGIGDWRRGMETFRLDENGNVRVTRIGYVSYQHYWVPRLQVATFKVSDEKQKKLTAAVEEYQVLRLKQNYRDERMADGLIYLMVIKQGEATKKVMMENRFPSKAVEFADAMYRESGVDALKPEDWRPTDHDGQDEVEKEVWGVFLRGK